MKSEFVFQVFGNRADANFNTFSLSRCAFASLREFFNVFAARFSWREGLLVIPKALQQLDVALTLQFKRDG